MCWSRFGNFESQVFIKLSALTQQANTHISALAQASQPSKQDYTLRYPNPNIAPVSPKPRQQLSRDAIRHLQQQLRRITDTHDHDHNEPNKRPYLLHSPGWNTHLPPSDLLHPPLLRCLRHCPNIKVNSLHSLISFPRDSSLHLHHQLPGLQNNPTPKRLRTKSAFQRRYSANVLAAPQFWYQ